MNTLAAISSILVATAAKATVVFLLAWCAALLLRRLSAATRHMLLVFAVAAALLLPFSAFLPQWHVRGVPDLLPQSAPAAAAPATVATSPAAESESGSPNIAARLQARRVEPARPARSNSRAQTDQS